MRIGLDIMGGDYAPVNPLKGAILARRELPRDSTLVLVGNESEIRDYLRREGEEPDFCEVVHASEVIGMGEQPTKAFSKKRDSSISVGFRLLAQGRIDGFASTGSSGAMLVGAVHAIGTVRGVIRPTITTAIPKENGSCNILLDVGLNADCRADVLYQFAILGSIYAEQVYHIKNPRVGLLNIGEEEEKGNLLSQAAFRIMRGSNEFNFIGNVEGRDMFDNKADVTVCEGFTGNVVLKTAEAIHNLIKKRGISDEYFDRFNYELYGGSPILGINAPVVVGHGSSSPLAIKNMLLLTGEVIEKHLCDRIRKAFE